MERLSPLGRVLISIAAEASGVKVCRACGERPVVAGSSYCAPCGDEVREMVDEHQAA